MSRIFSLFILQNWFLSISLFKTNHKNLSSDNLTQHNTCRLVEKEQPRRFSGLLTSAKRYDDSGNSSLLLMAFF